MASICLVFKWHLKTRPFGIRPLLDHSNTWQVRYSEPHCSEHLNSRNIWRANFYLFVIQMVCYSDVWYHGIIADRYSNGGLNTCQLTKQWSEYQNTMVLGMYMPNFGEKRVKNYKKCFKMVKFGYPPQSRLAFGCQPAKRSVTRPLCLVRSRSQYAAASVGVLSVYLTTILYYHHQLFFDLRKENIPWSITVIHS